MNSKLSYLVIILLAILSLIISLPYATVEAAPLENDDIASILDASQPSWPDQEATKFILLTTGLEIKLYPSAKVDSDNYLLIKPRAFNDTQHLEPKSAFTKWIHHKTETLSNLKTDSGANIRRSILPKNRTKSMQLEEHEELLFDQQHQSGFKWQKPLITKVDYFYNAKYCDSNESGSDNQCLVVIWLDKNNKFARYGSVILDDKLNVLQEADNFRAHNASSNPSLLLDEFPPIDLCQQIGTADKDCEVQDMIVDKHKAKLVVIMSAKNDLGQAHINRVLSLELDSINHYNYQIKSKDVLVINENCSLTPFESRLANLNLVNSNWLIYLEKSNGGKVMAVDIMPEQSFNRSASARQIQIFDVRYNLPIGMMEKSIFDSKGGRKERRWPTPVAMALDRINLKLYFLMEDNRIFNTDLIGNNAQYLGQLPNKPIIRSPNDMQILGDSLLISDSSRRSLVSISLASIQNSDADNLLERAKAVNKVLLVELPTIQNFRILTRNEDMSNSCDGTDSLLLTDTAQVDREQVCSQLEQLVSHLNFEAIAGKLNHCSEWIFVGRDDWTSLNIAKESFYLSNWALVSLSATLLILTYAILRILWVLIKHFNKSKQDDKSAILPSHRSSSSQLD